MESFTPLEQQKLLTYFSNTNHSVFVLRNLPEVVKGTLFSRYSRTTKSLRRLFLDEFASEEFIQLGETVPTGIREDSVRKAEEFYQRVLDGYGDDSVGELGGCHVAVENISNIATKVIEDCRLGGSPIEKSTRYVQFDQRDENGQFRYYRDSYLLESKFGKKYEQVMDHLFETYAQLIPKLSEFIMQYYSLDDFEFPVDLSGKQLVKYRDMTDEVLRKKAQTAYKSSIRSKVCDALRYLLPTGTLTNMGLYGNGRFFDGLLKKLYAHPLPELNELAVSIHRELDTQIKPFVRRAKKEEYLTQRLAREKAEPSIKDYRLKLVQFDPQGTNQVMAGILFELEGNDLGKNFEKAAKMSIEEKKEWIKRYVGTRATRRDRPARAFELASVTFDVCSDFGAYRDLQRHRVLTQQRQRITCDQGFETPDEIRMAGLTIEYESAMNAAKELYDEMKEEFPFEAQYVVPFGYRISYFMKMNIREAFHLIELRSSKQGHPSYRKIAIEMFHELQKTYPELAFYMNFVDENDYAFARLASEMRQELKKKEQ